jgi:uncharacterized protein
MLYRKLGKTNENVSILGMGAMRLPVKNENYGDIDELKSSEMLKYALDNGINYIDTAYPYHNGASEKFLGRFFEKYPSYLEDAFIASKMPSWLIESQKDMDHYLEQQLNSLKMEKIDFYLLHSLKPDYWENLLKNDVFEFLDSAVEEGKIKYTGFSFHGEIDLFFEVVDSYEWDICQIQLNYMDENHQAGVEGLKYAKSQNLGTVIMEPLRGGCLTRNIPEDVQEIWNLADEPKTPPEWGFKYLWDYEDIDIVLSGMSTLEQIEENIGFAESGLKNSFTKNDKEIIKEVKMAYRENIAVDCTSCGYCMPCPEGVDIPKNFNILNNAYMFNDPNGLKMQYMSLLTEKQRASSCKMCGECQKMCPQMIPITEKLKEVVDTFENDK